TPLASALRLAHTTLVQRARRTAGAALLVLVSDGRANASASGQDPFDEALGVARLLAGARTPALVVDSEGGPVRLGFAHRVCAALPGHYVRRADLRGGSLAGAIRALHGSLA